MEDLKQLRQSYFRFVHGFTLYTFKVRYLRLETLLSLYGCNEWAPPWQIHHLPFLFNRLVQMKAALSLSGLLREIYAFKIHCKHQKLIVLLSAFKSKQPAIW